ncbi:MAG: carboxypeptidase regulatory-like domain-containing protein, partial [bacterium]|nr:carboxypeptidase regulatory-like domain-containing protein [bacterium]
MQESCLPIFSPRCPGLHQLIQQAFTITKTTQKEEFVNEKADVKSNCREHGYALNRLEWLRKGTKPRGGGVDDSVQKKEVLLNEAGYDYSEIRQLIIDEVKKSSLARIEGMMMAPVSADDIYFALSKIDTVVDTDGLHGYIKYAFVYKEGLVNPPVRTWEGTIRFDYEWIDVAPKSWQETGYELDTQVASTGKITGVVKNEITGEPMERVSVYGEDATQNPVLRTMAASTDTEGRYLIEDALMGTYTLFGMADGFQIGSLSGVSVTEGDTTAVSDLLLLPIGSEGPAGENPNSPGEITGRVVNTPGAPVPGVTVYLVGSDSAETPVPVAKTDGNGNYTLTTVPAGDYIVKARIEGIEGSTTVSLTTGETVNAPDIVLSNTPPVISSLSSDSATVYPGEQVTFRVSAGDGDGDDLYYYWTSNDHTDRLSLSFDPTVVWTASDSPGVYTITVRVSDKKGGSATKSLDIEVVASGGSGGPTASLLEDTFDGTSLDTDKWSNEGNGGSLSQDGYVSLTTSFYKWHSLISRDNFPAEGRYIIARPLAATKPILDCRLR